MADEFEFVGYVTPEQAAQIEKNKELTTVAQDPNLEIIDPFEHVSDRWIGPAPQNLGATEGFEDYLQLVELNKKRDRGAIEELFDPEMAEVPFVGGFAEAGKLLRIADIAKRMNKGESLTDKELLDFNAYMEYSKRKENASLGSKVIDVIQNSLSFWTEIGVGLLMAGSGLAVAGVGAVGKKSASTGAKKVLNEAIEKAVKEAAESQAVKAIKGSAAAGARKTIGDFAEKVATNYAYQRGAFKGINEVVQKKALDLIGDHVSPKAANLLAKSLGAGIELEAKAVALQLLNPDNTVASYANKKVQAALANEDPSEATLIFKALMDTNIEYFSEFSGEYIGKVAGRVVNPKMRKALTQSAVYQFLSAKYDTLAPKAITEVLAAVGVGNIMQEMSEERLGGFLRGLWGVDSTPGLTSAIKGIWPGGEEMMVEAIAFAALPVGMYMANRATGGASAKDRQQFAEAIKNFKQQKDIVGVAESDMLAKADPVLKIIETSKKPWYSGIKWFESLFGEERRGSLRDGLQSVADVLEEKGINILKVLDKDSAPREERLRSLASTMALMQNVTWEKLTAQDAELLNGGLKDSSVIKKNLGGYRATVLTEKFLNKDGARELAAKVGNLPVETTDIRNLSYGSYVSEQFAKSWDQLEIDEKNQFMARWGTQDKAWAKQKYEGIKALLATSWGNDFQIVDTLPALLVKTKAEWEETGNAIGSKDLVWGKNEKGEDTYAKAIFAWNDGETIGLAPSSDMSDISEDTMEAGLKKRYGDKLPDDAEMYLDQLRINLVNERDGRNPAKDVDFLPQQRRDKEEAINTILTMLDTPNGRREVFAKAAVMNRLGHSDVSGRYSQANQIFGLLAFDDAFDGVLEDILPRDILNALNKSAKTFTGREMSPRGMEIRDALLSRRRGATAVVRTALNKAIAEYEEKQAADQILVKLKEAQNVAESDIRKKKNVQSVKSAPEIDNREAELIKLISNLNNSIDQYQFNHDGNVAPREWYKKLAKLETELKAVKGAVSGKLSTIEKTILGIEFGMSDTEKRDRVKLASDADLKKLVLEVLNVPDLSRIIDEEQRARHVRDSVTAGRITEVQGTDNLRNGSPYVLKRFNELKDSKWDAVRSGNTKKQLSEHLDKDITFSLAVASVSPDGEITLKYDWTDRLLNHKKRKLYDDGTWTFEKMLTEAGLPKDEKQKFLEYAKDKSSDLETLVKGFEDQIPKLKIEPKTGRVYENFSVNKGQGEYKEYFIKTPFNVPGQHGDFTDPNLAGWFRVREYPRGTTEKRGLSVEEVRARLSPDDFGELADDYGAARQEAQEMGRPVPTFEEYAVSTKWVPASVPTGTIVEPYLEIQEIQSELFQKNKGGFVGGDLQYPRGWAPEQIGLPRPLNTQQTAFLNLMLKNQTWVPVFINAITQWAKNQGFTKVRFPTGETAARVEGHEALADRLMALQEERSQVGKTNAEAYPAAAERLSAWEADADTFDPATLKQIMAMEEWMLVPVLTRPVDRIDAEIQTLKTQGIEKLAPIEGFYEKRIGKMVERMGARPATDSQGYTWRELPLVDTGITFSASAQEDLNKIGKEIQEITDKLNSSSRFAWAQYISEIDKTFDFETIKKNIKGLFVPETADKIIEFLENANKKYQERLEQIEMPPQQIVKVEEGTKDKEGQKKEKRVFGKTATPGDAYAEWSLKGEEGEFEPEYNFAYENDFADLIDADLIPAWLRTGAPKAMALWATMEDLYDRDSLELIAAIGLQDSDSFGVWEKPASIADAVSQLNSLRYKAGAFLDQEGIGTLTSTKDGKVVISQPDYSGREERGRYRDIAEDAEASLGTGSGSDLDYEYEEEGLISIDEMDVEAGITADEANRIFQDYVPRNVYDMEELDPNKPLADQIEVIYPIGGKAAREMTNPITGLAKKVGTKLFEVEIEDKEPMSTKGSFTIVSTPTQLRRYQFGEYIIGTTKDGRSYPIKKNTKQPGYTWNRTLDIIKKPLTAGFSRSDRYNVQGVIIVVDPFIENKTSYVASRMIYAGQTGRYVDMPVMIEWAKNKRGKYYLDNNGVPAIKINNRDLLAQLPLQFNTRNNFDDGASNFATFVISADRLRSMKGQRSTKLAGEIRKWMLKNRIKRLGIMEMDAIPEDYANFVIPDYHDQLQATIATSLNMKTQEDAAIMQREQEIAIEMLEKFERSKEIENQSVPVTKFKDMQKAAQDGLYVTIGEVEGRNIGSEFSWLWDHRRADTSVSGELTTGDTWIIPAYNIESPKTERFDPNVFAAGIRDLNDHASNNPEVRYYVVINPETMAYLNEGLAEIDPFFEKVAASDATGQQKFTRNDILSYFAREDLAPNLLFMQKDAKQLSISIAPLLTKKVDLIGKMQSAISDLAEGRPEAFQQIQAQRELRPEFEPEAPKKPSAFPTLELQREAGGVSVMENELKSLKESSNRRKDSRVHLSVRPQYFSSVHDNVVDIRFKRGTNEHFAPPGDMIIHSSANIPDLAAGEEYGVDPETASRQTASNYRSWLNGTGFKNLEQERRKWILSQVENLRGKILVGRDDGLTIDNYAYVLSNMVNTLYPTKKAKATAKVSESLMKPLVLTKIISGGQTGADRAGLEVGKELGIETGGYAPAGFETERGLDESLKEFGLVEVKPEQTKAYTGKNKKWGPRTEFNVKESDGTVWFGNESPGKQLTRRHAFENGKPFIENPTDKQLNKWLRINQIKVLNVAGNRASGNRTVSDKVADTLTNAIKLKNTISTTYSSGIVQYELGISPVVRWIVQDATAFTSIAKLKSLEGYVESKTKNNIEAAKNLARQLINADNVSGLVQQDDILVPIYKGSNSSNLIPFAMAARIAELTGAKMDHSIVQTNKSSHLGSSAAERLLTKATYAGPVVPGQNYIIVDDVLTSGSTISGLREFIESHGGHVTGVIGAAAGFSPQTGSALRIAPEKEVLDEIRTKMSETQLTEILNDYGIAQSLEHLTASQARYIATFATIESFRDKLNDTIEELESKIVPTAISEGNGASELATVQPTYSLSLATIFDRAIETKLWSAMTDKNKWDYNDDEVMKMIADLEVLKERFRNYPEMTIEEINLDNRFATPLRDEAVAYMIDQVQQYREFEPFREKTMSLGLAQDYMDRADVWFYGGSTGLKTAFLDMHREMKAAMHTTGLWGNRLREAVGIGNTKIPKEERKLVTEAARLMLRALKHRIDNPYSQIIITGRRDNGYNEDRSKRYAATSSLPSIDEILEKYNEFADKYDLMKSDIVMNEIRSRIQGERVLVNKAVADMTEKEWIDVIENYMHHSYQKRDKDPGDKSINTVAGEFAGAKSRVFPTFDDAIRFGYVPTSEDAISNTLTWSKTAWKKARDKFVLNAGMIMTETDGAPVMLPIFGSAAGPTLFDNDAIRKLMDNLVTWANVEFKLDLKVDTKAEPRNELMRLMTQIPKLDKKHGYQQVNVENLSGVTGIIVLQGPAENMLRYIDSSRWTNKAITVIEGLNSWMKFLALSLSLFHPFALLESFVAASGLTLKNPVFHPYKTYQAYQTALNKLKTDPEYSAFWIRNGLEVNVTSPDIDKGGIINTQISNWMEHMNILSDNENTNAVQKKVGQSVETGLKAFQKLKDIWDRKLWQELQPALKVMIAEEEKQRQEVRLDRQLEKHELAAISQYVNFAFGGVEFEKFAWTNPKVMQAIHLGMFAPDWTTASAGIAGLGKLFGVKYSDIQKDASLMRYWPAMIALIMYGVPAAIQGSFYVLFGDPDDGDEMFPWNNGPDRINHIDITPLARMLPGYAGDPTGKRRVYLRFGKQVYEVSEGWLGKPWETAKSKTSLVVKSVAEQVTGESMNGWELGFKDKGLLGIVQGEGGFWDSRLGTQLQHFLPMSLLTYAKGHPTSVFAPTSRGLSPTATIKNMSAKLDAFADSKNDKVIKQYNLRLEDVVAEDIHWAEVNGYNAGYVFKRAVSAVRSKYYSEFFYALDKGDQKEMKELAYKILKLGGIEENLVRSVRGRLTNVGKKMGPDDLSAIQSAFNS